MYEMGKEPYTKYVREIVKLTPEWKEYRFLGYADRAFQPGESQFKFFLGYESGTFDIAGVRVENYGAAPENMFTTTVDWYGGAEVSDAWRKPALERIEKIRKGDLRVLVTDANGRPVPNVTVRVEQKRHHFRWGSAVVAGRLVDTTNRDNLRYQAEVKRLFNTVVFENDMKWPQSDNNPAGLARVDKAMEWLRANKIDVRGHNLVWGSEKYLPQSTVGMSAEQLKKVVEDRTRSFAERFKGQIYTWDVVNEAATNTSLWEKIGWEHFANTYKWAREADPNALLTYNDYNMVNESSGPNQRNVVKQRIQYLLDNGAPLDIIGDQAHMGVPLTPMSRVLEITDEFAKYGKRIEFTELDAGIKDDKVHGEYVRDFLIAAFSHPSVDAVIQWGFWENAHWRAKKAAPCSAKTGASVRRRKLTKTSCSISGGRAQRAKSNAQGAYSTRAFHGAHTVTVGAGWPQDHTGSATTAGQTGNGDNQAGAVRSSNREGEYSHTSTRLYTFGRAVNCTGQYEAGDLPIGAATMTRHSRYRGRGFTLIEILIVVAVLALLAAILFPIFARARENARRASCASNLKQLATAAVMYAQDYDERTVPGFIRYAPPPDFTSFARWNELLQPYLKNQQVNICPSAGDLSTRAGGYGINKNLSGYADPSFTTGATRSLSEVTDAAGTAFIVDAAQCAGEVAAEQNSQNWNGYVTGPTDWQWTPPARGTARPRPGATPTIAAAMRTIVVARYPVTSTG
jgi:prepilin-type N-terminal cleavage/methylation domain-containing protein